MKYKRHKILKPSLNIIKNLTLYSNYILTLIYTYIQLIPIFKFIPNTV